MKSLSLSALSLLLLTALPPAAGQSGDPAVPDAAFTETVDVDVVNVEVYVTDKSGRRIQGLTRDDFELRVDRQQVPVSYFYAVQAGRVLDAGASEPGPDETPPAVRSPQPAETIPEEQRLHLVIYVDNVNIDPLHRNRLFSHVRTFLGQHLRPADQVMVVSYDRSLHQRLSFTSDPGLVAEALYDLEEVSGHAARAAGERRDLLDAIYEEANPDPREQVVARVAAHAREIANDLEFTVDALKEMVENLAGLPGRKAILYLSDGLAMRPGEDLFYALQERWEDSRYLLEAQSFDASRRFQELTARANAHRVTFYAVDAAGLRTYTYNDASNSSPTGGVAIDEAHFANLRSPLQLMAEETGGLAIVNTSRFLPLLERVAEDFESYYSLGFVPASGDNRYRKIEVRVAGRKDLVVRHREGYRNRPAAARMRDSTLAALRYGNERNDLGVELEIGSGTPGEKDDFLVPVVVRIPMAELGFLPRGETHQGRLRLYIAAQDADGGSSSVQEVPVPIEIPSADLERARGKLYHHRFTLRMRRGRQLLAVGVRDEIGALTGFVVGGAQIGG